MSTERPPRLNVPAVESVGTEPRPEATREMVQVINELVAAVPAETIEVARSAATLRRQLLERRMHDNPAAKEIHHTALQDLITREGINNDDYEMGRILATVPSESFPSGLQAKRLLLRERLIDPIDQAIAENSTLKKFFPDPRLHQADLYQISYDYALAISRLDLKRDKGRDSLTGLINDQGFLAEIFEANLKLLALLEGDRAMAVFRIDLDGFKAVNERYTHSAGDRVLKEFADQLRLKFKRTFDTMSVNPESDQYSLDGRPGGDEFVLMVNDINMSSDPAISNADYEHYPDDLLQRYGIGNRAIFGMAKLIAEAAAAVHMPDGSKLTASVGFARIHQEEASRMLYGRKGSEYDRRNFSFYNHAADSAAQYAKEWGDGIAYEWTPRYEPVPMTFERLLKKGIKRFNRDHPSIPVDEEIMTMLQDQATLLVQKYAQLAEKK